MIFCLQAELRFLQAARRDAVLADMQARVADRPRWREERLEAGVSKGGLPCIHVTVRFTSRADQEDLKARVESFATGTRAPQPGSWVRIHDCTHDAENPEPCVVAAQRTW